MIPLQIIAVIMGAVLSGQATAKAMTADPAYYNQPPALVTSYDGQPLRRRPYPQRNILGSHLPLRQDSFYMRRQDSYPNRQRDDYPVRQQDNYQLNHNENYPRRQQDGYNPMNHDDHFPNQQDSFPLRQQDNFVTGRPFMSTDLDRNGRQMRYRNNDIREDGRDRSGYYPNREQQRDDANYYNLNDRDRGNGYAPNYQDSRRSGDGQFSGSRGYPLDRTPGGGRNSPVGFPDEHPLLMGLRR